MLPTPVQTSGWKQPKHDCIVVGALHALNHAEEDRLALRTPSGGKMILSIDAFRQRRSSPFHHGIDPAFSLKVYTVPFSVGCGTTPSGLSQTT